MNPDHQTLVNWAYQKVVEANGDERGIKLAIAGVLVETERPIADLTRDRDSWEEVAAQHAKDAVSLASQVEDLTRQRDEAVASEARAMEFCVGLSMSDPEKHPVKLLEARNKIAALRLQLEAETKARVAAELAHETDTGRLKADLATMRGLLAREVLIEDDYGVHGSTFYTCPFCHQESGAGALNKGIPHDQKCILAGECTPCESIVAMAEERESLTARVAELEADRGWRTMDDAPKDGTVIVVPGGIAHWHGGEWKTLTGEAFPGRPIEWEVTAWQPLPAARSAQPEGGV